MIRFIIIPFLLLLHNNYCWGQQSEDYFEKITIVVDDIDGVIINSFKVDSNYSPLSKSKLDSILSMKGRRRTNSFIVFTNNIKMVPDINIKYKKVNLSLSAYKLGKELLIYSIIVDFESDKSDLEANLSIMGQAITKGTSFWSIYDSYIFQKYINYAMYANEAIPNESFLHLTFPNCYIAFSFDNEYLTNVVIIL